MAQELTARLPRLPGVRVAASTSAFALHNRTPDARTIVVNNNIVCSDGGHLRCHKDDKVVWDSRNYKFSLRGAAPPSDVRHFEGTLALTDPNNPPAYKYTVFVDGYVTLDLIIIVDRN